VLTDIGVVSHTINLLGEFHGWMTEPVSHSCQRFDY